MDKVEESKIAIGMGIFGVMAVIALIIGGMVIGYAIFRRVILVLRGYDDTTPLQ